MFPYGLVSCLYYISLPGAWCIGGQVMHQDVGVHGQRVGQSHILVVWVGMWQEPNPEPPLGHARATPSTNHDQKPANPPPHKTLTTTNPRRPSMVSGCIYVLPSRDKQPGHTNPHKHPPKSGGAPWPTPLVSAFVSLIVVGGCWGVVLVVCFWCVLGGFLFCFCFVFCFFLFSFCVGGGGIVRFI